MSRIRRSARRRRSCEARPRYLLWGKHHHRTPTKLQKTTAVPGQQRSPFIRHKNDHLPINHCDTWLGVAPRHNSSQSTSRCHIGQLRQTYNSEINALVHRNVIHDCSSLLAPLDNSTACRQSITNDRVEWTDTKWSVQTRIGLKQNNSSTRPEDELWIVTDRPVKECGVAATMYAMQKGKLKLAGFVSAKLGGRGVTWLPCEIEAMTIAVALRHFSPYIVQSDHKSSVLTDGKPCVQAYEKLCRGEFSVSPRVSTFLSVVSRYQASVRHLSGSANVPSDFAIRNAPTCTDQRCYICTFIRRMEDSVVQRITTADTMSGKSVLPFSSRSA